MKVKILLMPLAIVIAVGLMVWLVYPAYSNGIDGVKEKKLELKKEKASLEKIESKINNADSLSAQIESLSADRAILFEFIPKTAKEEQVLDSLNFLTSKSSLGMFDMGIVQIKEDATQSAQADEMVSDQSDGGTLLLDSESGDEIAEPMEVLPKAKNIEADVKAIGTYEKIKEFLTELEKSGRYNSCATVNIMREKEDDPNMLTFNFKVDFSSLKEAKISNSSINNKVFSKSTLDTEIVNAIKNEKNTKIFQLNVGEIGKANPFAM